MDIITMLASMLSVALGSMALGLCILYRRRNNVRWATLMVAFLSVLLGAVSLMALEHYTSFSLTMFGRPEAARVVAVVFECIITLCGGFLVLFIPFFIGLVVGTLHHQRLFWSGLSLACALYTGSGLFRLIGDVQWLFYLQAVIFVADYFASMTVLWVNLSKIQAQGTRRVILAANIVSLSLVPVFIFTVVFDSLRSAGYALYCMAFEIVMVVFFFSSFASDEASPQGEPKELELEDLAGYRISEREFGVIRLIAEGLTNKEIGIRLNISVNTVNNHVANIFSKTGVRSRIDLLNMLKEVQAKQP